MLFWLSRCTDKPVIDRSPIISKSATDNGSSGKLICRATGAPNVTFTWSREGSTLSKVDSGVDGETPKYTVEATSQLDLVTYESVLVIHDVAANDYGPYDWYLFVEPF